MKMPEETHNGNLNRTKVVAQPDAGTRQSEGKSNEPDGALISGPAPTPVTNATVDEGATRRCVDRQVNGPDGKPDGNPKKQVTGLFRQES